MKSGGNEEIKIGYEGISGKERWRKKKTFWSVLRLEGKKFPKNLKIRKISLRRAAPSLEVIWIVALR